MKPTNKEKKNMFNIFGERKSERKKQLKANLYDFTKKEKKSY